jgi:hypothetical protein
MHLHQSPNNKQQRKEKTMKILNFTPHAVTIKTASATNTYNSVGVARADTRAEVVGYIDDLPIIKKTFGNVYGLPESVPNDTVLIVSSLTAQAAKAQAHPLADRLYIVNDTVRDENGRIIACTSLAQV